MNQRRRRLLLLFTGVLILYLGSYFLYGKDTFPTHSFRNANYAYFKADTLIICIWNEDTDFVPAFNENQVLQHAYKNDSINTQYRNVLFYVAGDDTFRQLVYKENAVLYTIGFQWWLPGYYQIGEEYTTFKHEDLFLESWRSAYIWLFFDWVQLYSENMGIS